MRIIGAKSRFIMRTTYTEYHRWFYVISYGSPLQAASIRCHLSEHVGLNYRRVVMESLCECFI